MYIYDTHYIRTGLVISNTYLRSVLGFILLWSSRYWYEVFHYLHNLINVRYYYEVQKSYDCVIVRCRERDFLIRSSHYSLTSFFYRLYSDETQFRRQLFPFLLLRRNMIQPPQPNLCTGFWSCGALIMYIGWNV